MANILLFKPGFGKGGTSKSFADFGRALHKLGHNIKYLCFAKIGHNNIQNITCIPDLDVDYQIFFPEILRFSLNHKRKHFANTNELKIEFGKAVQKVKHTIQDFCKKHDIDHIITSGIFLGDKPVCSQAIIEIAKEIKVIVRFHDGIKALSDIKGFIRDLDVYQTESIPENTIPLNKILPNYPIPINNPNIIYSPTTSGIADDLKRHFSIQKTTILPNLFFEEEFLNLENIRDKLDKEHNIPKDSFLILQSTRCEPRKRPELALEFAEYMANELPVSFVLVDKNATYLTSKKVNVQIIQSKGNFLPEKFFYNLFYSADLITFLSTHEGFGRPVIEAGLLKKRFVTSNYTTVSGYPLYQKDFKGFDHAIIDSKKDFETATKKILDNKFNHESNYKLAKTYLVKKNKDKINTLLNS